MHEQQGNKGTRCSIFISYAHEDELLRQQLETHLSLLRRQGLIADWHDHQILAGDEWARDIDEHLEAASIILLLISPDFLASDYCYEIEMQRALERHNRGETRVIPIILRPVDWHTSPFAHLQCLPRDGKAVTTWQNPDEAFLAIAQGLRRVIERQQVPLHPIPEVERQNRRVLIKRVRVTWIEGLLEHSLHEATRLELHLQERSDVLNNPWRLQVQELDRPPQDCPAGTSIVQVYDGADGELLILGEPGAGKTTLLLDLARTLLERTEADERHRIPVVFNLSSWAEKGLPLVKWFVEELWTKYQIPRKIGQSWTAADQLLPLLDGLDEVTEEVRLGCVQAINTYHQERVEQRGLGLAPLVVCCRIEEYMTLSTRVTLRQAVSVQPLTDDQIERYLQSATSQLEGLRHVLRQDQELYELARRPLMLSIFTLAYQGVLPKNLPTEGTREAKPRQVFATYVERMLTRRGAFRRVSHESALRWLTFLAARMQQHHQTVLYLEHLQPSWLIIRKRRLLYRFSIVLTIGLAGGLLSGLLGELLVELVVGLVDGPPDLLRLLVFGLIAGLIAGLPVGLVAGLVFGLSQIHPRQMLIRSWRVTERSIIDGLVVGLIFALAVVLIFGLTVGLAGGLLVGLAGGLLSGLVGALASGFSTNLRNDRTRLTPNQGIWRSMQNGLVVGPGTGLVVGLVAGLPMGLADGPVFGLTVGLGTGLLAWLIFGLPAMLIFGLGAFLQHFTLRFWLSRAGCLPWNLVIFLDEAAERLLLRKVGGGYIFVHRLLLDYFASLEMPSSQKRVQN